MGQIISILLFLLSMAVFFADTISSGYSWILIDSLLVCVFILFIINQKNSLLKKKTIEFITNNRIQPMKKFILEDPYISKIDMNPVYFEQKCNDITNEILNSDTGTPSRNSYDITAFKERLEIFTLAIFSDIVEFQNTKNTILMSAVFKEMTRLKVVECALLVDTKYPDLVSTNDSSIRPIIAQYLVSAQSREFEDKYNVFYWLIHNNYFKGNHTKTNYLIYDNDYNVLLKQYKIINLRNSEDIDDSQNDIYITSTCQDTKMIAKYMAENMAKEQERLQAEETERCIQLEQERLQAEEKEERIKIKQALLQGIKRQQAIEEEKRTQFEEEKRVQLEQERLQAMEEEKRIQLEKEHLQAVEEEKRIQLEKEHLRVAEEERKKILEINQNIIDTSKYISSNYHLMATNFINNNIWLKNNFLNIKQLEEISSEIKTLMYLNTDETIHKFIILPDNKPNQFQVNRHMSKIRGLSYQESQSDKLYNELKIFSKILVESGLPTNLDDQQLIIFSIWKSIAECIIYELADELVGKELLEINESIEELIYNFINEIRRESYQDKSKLFYQLLKKDVYDINKLYVDYKNFCIIYDESIEKIKVEDYKKMLIKEIDEQTPISIYDIDHMSGFEFEQYIATLFNDKGYRAYTTKASGDQGIDVIAERFGEKIGIQAKCYQGKVSNTAIQEAVAGKSYYKVNHLMVITNAYFTKSAEELA